LAEVDALMAEQRVALRKEMEEKASTWQVKLNELTEHGQSCSLPFQCGNVIIGSLIR
jgi:hypothetical protein